MDLRDLLDPGRDAQLDDDLTLVEGALDALPKLADAWERLPPSKRAEYTDRWRERMLTLESLPGRLFRGRPTLLQQARLLDWQTGLGSSRQLCRSLSCRDRLEQIGGVVGGTIDSSRPQL